MARRSSGVTTPPVGLQGELSRMTEVRSVTAASTRSAWTRKPSSPDRGTNTGSAPAKRTCSGKLTQQGDGSTTCEPGS